ncbi:MAG: hypothetical protein DI586_11005 [Micavibrio aeruginosavorus]|uniref:Peptidase S24/S26A/S26B/S26C domain-containing protein n=1 Tax=Micavibrio aeruginosavorus TaxID=349221 RepID=A0A2W5FGP3_9BACT|nr:MAG: hypothetical protein DI586_11005 [Micavibrio aeruginosavorus]
MDAKWLNDQFDKNPEKSKGDLSDVLGIQASGISKMLAGTRQIKAKEYMLMRKFFDMPGTGDAVIRKSGSIQSSSALRAEDPSRQSWTTQTPFYDVVEVIDSAMVPDFLPGERVLIDGSGKLEDRPGIFAIKHQGKTMIRIAEKISASSIKLSSISKPSEAETISTIKLKILGRVIAKLNWL